MKGEIAVRYTIRHFDLPLITFEANMDSADTDLHIIKVYEENRSFLPLNLTVSEDGVERWLRHRTIPKNRAYVDALLSKVGLSLNRPLGIIAANKGLSLNDCFWVDAEGSGDTFEKVSLYDNRFSQVLAAIAFTGYGSSIRTSLASCPEFSTNGMLPKCWRRQNGKIYLYKDGTSGFSNLGFEPYSELYAYQVAQVMGVNAIRYTLTKDLKKTLCSKCELFTSKEYSYTIKQKLENAKTHAEFDKLLQEISAVDAEIDHDNLTSEQKTHYDQLNKSCTDTISAKMRQLEYKDNIDYNKKAVNAYNSAFTSFKNNESRYKDKSQLLGLVSTTLFAYDAGRLFNETLIFYNHVYSYIFNKLDDNGKLELTKYSIECERKQG